MQMFTSKPLKLGIRSFLFFFLIGYAFPLASQADAYPAGLYLSPTSIQNKTPDYSLEEVSIKEGKVNKTNFFAYNWWGVRVNEKKELINCVKVKKISKTDAKGKKILLPLSGVIAIATAEDLYFNVNDLFVKAQITGALCHITLEEIKTTNNGEISFDQPSSLASKTKFNAKQFLYKTQSGELLEMNSENLEQLILDDQKLTDHFQNNENQEDQLFLYLLKYNERNEAGIPAE